MMVTGMHLKVQYSALLYCTIITLVIIGAIYSFYKYVWKNKKSWVSLFRPDANWGPEYAVRQIRKHYDSREYVGSQAPRVLSRYMFHKAEAKAYILDIRYDTNVRRSTSPNVDLHIENEVKKDV